ncbi:pentapeptide repeat-containing protein, partial [Burkholderia pseudomallei]|uniref:pentapeptide repeat-containing protein n=1 Tax=Burkholderia pseudomallei TaxID=28450 RepID=UPI001C379980
PTLGDAATTCARCGGAGVYGAQPPRVGLRAAALRGARAGASTSFRQADLRIAAPDDANWWGVDLRGLNLHAATLDGA